MAPLDERDLTEDVPWQDGAPPPSARTARGEGESNGWTAGGPRSAAAVGCLLRPAPASRPLGIRALLRALRYRWPTASVLGLLAAAAAGVAVWFRMPGAPPAYRAVALLKLQPTETRPLGGRGSSTSEDWLAVQRPFLDQIKTRFVLAAALRQPAAAALPSVRQDPEAVRQRLENQLHVELGPEAQARLTLTGPAPEELVALVNAVRDAYRDEVLVRGGFERRVRLAALTRLQSEFHKELLAVRAERLQDVTSEETAWVEGQRRTLQQQQTEVQKALLQVEADLAQVRQGLEALVNRPAPQPQIVPARYVEEVVQADPQLQELLQQQEQLKLAMGQIEDVADKPDDWDEYREYRSQLKKVAEAIARRRRELEAPVLEKQQREAQTASTELDRKVSAGREQLMQLEADRQELTGRMQRQLAALNELNDSRRVGDLKQRETQQAKDGLIQRCRALAEQAQRAIRRDDLEACRNGYRLSALGHRPWSREPAEEPGSADWTQEELDFLTAEHGELADRLLALLTPIADWGEARLRAGLEQKDLRELQSLAAEKLDVADHTLNQEVQTLQTELTALQRISPYQDAQAEPLPAELPLRRYELTGLAGGSALLGMLLTVAVGEARRRRLYAAEEAARQLGLRLLGTLPAPPGRTGAEEDLYWQSLMTEAVHGIRTAFGHATDALGARLVLIASAVSGEGRTTLASQLAVSLARAGKRVLLLDADLVHPLSHELFGLPSQPGLCELLRGQAKLAVVVRPTPVARLWLLPAGRADTAAIQALDQQAVDNILELLKARYDVILLDSSPLLSFAHSLLLARRADAAVLAMQRTVSRAPQVQAACQRLAAQGIPLLGAVFLGEQRPAYMALR